MISGLRRVSRRSFFSLLPAQDKFPGQQQAELGYPGQEGAAQDDAPHDGVAEAVLKQSGGQGGDPEQRQSRKHLDVLAHGMNAPEVVGDRAQTAVAQLDLDQFEPYPPLGHLSGPVADMVQQVEAMSR